MASSTNHYHKDLLYVEDTVTAEAFTHFIQNSGRLSQNSEVAENYRLLVETVNTQENDLIFTK